jgi:hypothetical protein
MEADRRQDDRRISQVENIVRVNTGRIGDLETIVMGPLPNRTNGIRGDLKAIEERLDDLKAWGEDIWNVRRREECLGIKECDKVRIEFEKLLVEDREMRKAQIGMRAVVLAAMVPATLTMLTQIALAVLMK